MITERSIPERVRDLVDRHPDREVITFRDLQQNPVQEHRLTYGELWRAALGFSASAAAVPPEARVLIVLPMGVRVVAAQLGVMLAGRIPIIHSHPSGKIDRAAYITQLTHVLRQMQPEAVITNRDFASTVRECVGGQRTQVTLEEEVAIGDSSTPFVWPAGRRQDIALIQHSSGSTGLQKGVALTHDMVLSQVVTYGRYLGLDESRDRICSWLPLYHDMGLFTSWLMPLLMAVPVAAIDPFAWIRTPGALLTLITDVRGSLCWQPNFAYNVLATRVRHEELSVLELSSMRGFVNCSEPVRADSHRLFVERFRTCGLREDALLVCYAMAENSFAVTAAGLGDTRVEIRTCDSALLSQGVVSAAAQGNLVEIVSVGAPVEGTEIKVVDDRRHPLEDDRVGEVALRSDCMLREYYRNPDATAASIDQDGWYFTGDLGFLSGGQLYITGREKDLLIVAGRNFYPQDIEAICSTIPGVAPGRVVAIGVEDDRTGTQRIVVLAESAVPAAEGDELGLTIRSAVGARMDCPVSEVHIVPPMWLAKTTSGKIARQANLVRLRTELAIAPNLSSDFESPSPSWRDTALWGAAAALALFVLLTLQQNLSWGVYAAF